MCRLFFSNNFDNVDLFINSATTGTKANNYEKCLDGYGLIWKTDKLLYSHISSVPYFKDDLYNKTILEIKEKKPKIVWGHVRKKTDNKMNKLQNNQPFFFKKEEVIFAHNGEINDFLKYKSLILSKIDQKYKAEIKGTTDSELIMFLYLTMLDKNVNKKNMRKSMNELLSFFEDNNISVVLNIICSIKDDTIICRHTVHPWKNKNYPSLFIDDETISTQRLNKNQTMIAKNSILISSLPEREKDHV